MPTTAAKTRNPLSLRLPEALRSELERQAVNERRTVSSLLAEMINEGLKSRRVPGVIYRDEGGYRSPRVARIGAKVLQIIAAFERNDGDFATVASVYDWLTEAELRMALAYWEAFPEEVKAWLQEERDFDPETFYRDNPWARPPEPPTG
ncbi:MAG: hypothetical protein WEB00_11430 [Dehalococcoidia bacterium]